MNTIATIGQRDQSIQYTDRPTVKVIVEKDNRIIIINNGLLPGGGTETDESDQDAITRELQEELGITVKDVQEIGTVVQYRTLLGKRYLINGYTAKLETTGGATNPQNEREAQFTVQWLTLDEAIAYVSESIDEAKIQPMGDATDQQSKLYNLMTTFELLKNLKNVRV